ncbi:nascent polypeptide-associated complex subunit alpha, muscle-specific form-like isoform X2 [Oryza brachyantha]|uniref:nascent polypeptide-associated complex subunit alpha, muscle-specific form-like isoform X2 n=1 Tax=Oryza brachyantha TaxID=4533 RepID=UPI001ADCB6DE|nr:nascent polypeptide-associated complex subunit alpha, muscle-specific form-like isoform X2 [Oryza brachyantha]
MSDLAAVAPAAFAGSGAIVHAGGGGAWPRGVRFGEMVWGKVKSHPWWPGHVYSITLTSDGEVRRGYRDGLVLVAFFGDSSYGWFEPHELLPFEENFPEKAAQGGGRNFPTAISEAADEVARRAALALLCPCRSPDAFRPHEADPRYLLVDVPGFDTDAEYHPDQVTAEREKIAPRALLDYLKGAALEQRDAADKVWNRNIPAVHMSAMLEAYRRSRFALKDPTYAQAFGMDYEKLQAEKAAALKKARQGKTRVWWDRKTQDEPADLGDSSNTSAGRPAKGRKKAAENPGRRRKGSAGSTAARIMEKIMPSAAAMKPRAKKKQDQYLLKRRDDARAPPPPSMPDAYPAAPALSDVPPGFPTDPPTPPLPSSTVGAAVDEEFLLQRRTPPLLSAPPTPLAPPPAAAGQVGDGGAPIDAAAAPKKAIKTKKAAGKREREEPAADASGTAAADADAGGEPKKKKKKKKLAELNGVAAPSGGAGGKPGLLPAKVDHNGVDLKQSHENDPPEENKGSDAKPNAATDGKQQPPAAKKKPATRPADPAAKATGVKRGPSDRQEELAIKKKAKLNKIRTLATDKKAAGLDAAAPSATAVAATPAAAQLRAGVERKNGAIAAARKKEKEPAPAMRTPSPMALMMKFPAKTTLPSVASLKARFARFGPLDVDGIRVYWKSHMCRVIYRFKSDAEAAIKYARTNAMFGPVMPVYYLRGVESSGADPADAAPPPPPQQQQQRSELRLMETAPFRPGSSGGNGAPLPLSRAVPARAVVGQPKSILKKTTDDAAPSAALRDAPRVKFMLDAGDSKLELPPAAPASGGGGGGVDAPPPLSKSATKSVGFAPQPLQPPARPAQHPHLQPPARPALQPPRPPVAQPHPPPPPVHQHQPYQPRHTDAPPPFSVQPQLPPPPPYHPRHSDGMHHQLPGPPPLPLPPYQLRTGGFPGQQQQTYRPGNGDDMPAWKRGGREFDEELMRVMLGIAKLVEPLTDKNGNFPYHLFSSA